MKYTAFVFFIVGFVTFYKGTHGLKCYVGCITSKTPEECEGSCFRQKVGNSETLGCLPQHMSDGCHTVRKVQACFCNTDLCNSNSNAPTSFLTLIGLKVNMASEKENLMDILPK